MSVKSNYQVSRGFWRIFAVQSVSFYKEQCKIPSSLKFPVFWLLVFLSYQKYDTRSLKSSKKIGNIPKYKKILYLFSYFVPYPPKFEYWFLRSCKYLSTVPYKAVPYKTILSVASTRILYSIFQASLSVKRA